MQNSSISETKFKNVKFIENNLTNSQLFKTKLKEVDFTSCNIEGITVGLEDVKGMIVNDMQALELSKLLGIIIK